MDVRITEDRTDRVVEERGAPLEVLQTGILLFNASARLIYMDPRAAALCGSINRSQVGYSTNVLPSVVTTFSSDIAGTMAERLAINDHSPFEMSRLLENDDQRVLLRGYGIPWASEEENGRVLIVMEDLTRRKEFWSKEASERFHLTEREGMVVRVLAKGYTNKQIGTSIGMTEQTVKEVIKRLMHKTKATTRTGVLIEVLRL